MYRPMLMSTSISAKEYFDANINYTGNSKKIYVNNKAKANTNVNVKSIAHCQCQRESHYHYRYAKKNASNFKANINVKRQWESQCQS